MDVDINLSARHLQKQQHYWEDSRGKNVAIRLDQSMLDEPIANEPSVYEHENRIAVQFLDLRLGDESVETEFARRRRLLAFQFLALPRWRLWQADALQRDCGGDRQKLVESVFAKYLVNALAVARHRSGNQHGIGRRV